MREVYVIGSHMIRFGKHLERSHKSLVAETVEGALADAGIEKERLGAAWFANSGWGGREGQVCIRGQVALRPLGIDAIPIMNVENACAGGSSAANGTYLSVASGQAECALAVGVEKLFHPNRMLMMAGFLGGLDVGDLPNILKESEEMERNAGISAQFPDSVPKPMPVPSSGGKKKKGLGDKIDAAKDAFNAAMVLGNQLGWDTLKLLRQKAGGGGGGGGHSPFMDVYSVAARNHMSRYGSSIEQLAQIASKNHYHSSLNPLAQYQFEMTPEEVLRDRRISYPLTRAMCAPIGDGAASAILCSEAFLKSLPNARPVRVAASVLGSGRARSEEEEDIGGRLGKIAYEKAGIGPKEIDLAELHDATAFGELHHCETLGFCGEGEGGPYALSGATKLGGEKPINTSGGLESRGHPIAASGLAQIHELVLQLRGEAGQRQVEGARWALAENGGGALGREEAAMAIHILEKAN